MNENFDTLGKIPPQSVELEECVLASIIDYPEILIEVKEILTPECFYKETNQIIYEQITALDKENKTIDSLMLVQKLKETENLDLVGGHYGISLLLNKSMPHGIVEKALIVKQFYFKRELIRISHEITKKAFNDSEDVFDIISDLSKETEGLLNAI
jgi:replicative DNA helicase